MDPSESPEPEKQKRSQSVHSVEEGKESANLTSLMNERKSVLRTEFECTEEGEIRNEIKFSDPKT